LNTLEKKHSISLDSVTVVSPESVSADLDGEVIILGFKSGSYFALDQVGGFVWDLLREPRKVSDIRDAIFETYDVEIAHCERDLLALLEELAGKQLIDIKNDFPA
jgi:hypothetical protein